MLHLDLFSGIGGFAYAVDEVWPNAEHVFVDNDKFCQQVLKKHWPKSLIYGDIRSVTADTFSRRYVHRQPKEQSTKPGHQAQRKSEPSVRPPFILTGGFPCQPFSAAGVRRGTSDERYLWPEMLRVIRLTKPTWVIAENVRGLLTWENGLVFEQICTDLEASGYEVQPFIIPAVAVNAPHRRDRIWFIAHAINDRPRQEKRGSDGASGQVPQEHRKKDSTAGQSKRTDSDRKDDELNSNAQRQRLLQRSEKNTERYGELNNRGGGYERADWDKDWLEVATEFCSVDDGLPVELDGFKLSKSKHRAEQLKAYGNAIVPQVAIEIMKGIKYSSA